MAERMEDKTKWRKEQARSSERIGRENVAGGYCQRGGRVAERHRKGWQREDGGGWQRGWREEGTRQSGMNEQARGSAEQ